MEQKRTYKVKNRNGIEAFLHHAQTIIECGKEQYCGDDEVILTIPDLCQDRICLHFSKAEARRLSRILWQMSARLMTAEERELEDKSDRPGVALDPDFFKDFQRMFDYGKRTK